MADRLAHFKCDIYRLKKRRLAEWLEQALHGPLFEHPWPDGRIFPSGDVNDRNLLPATSQFLLEIRAGHTWHRDVENQALRLPDELRREELFGRGERLNHETARPQQVRKGFPHGLVVINYRHE